MANIFELKISSFKFNGLDIENIDDISSYREYLNETKYSFAKDELENNGEKITRCLERLEDINSKAQHLINILEDVIRSNENELSRWK